MKFKKTGVVLMACCLVVGGGIYNTAYAMEQKEQILVSSSYSNISSYWTNISDITVDISSSKTKLYPEAYIKAKSSTGKITGTMYLEKYASGSWTRVTSWSINRTGSVFLSKTYQGTSGTKYRVRAVVSVSGETVEVISGTCTI